MPLNPITHQSWLFTPPLDVPLELRLENGRFDSIRPRPLPQAPPCATTHVIPGDDPDNPTGVDVHFAAGLHQAVDLASVAGNCVYAASGGRVVDVDRNPAATKGNVTIDHHPDGLGFATRYQHITDITVSPGDHVSEGEPFAQVSAEPEHAHLHFELWVHLGHTGPPGQPGGREMAPVDPTRALYAWEQRLVPDQDAGDPLVPLSVGVTRVHTVPFFVAAFEQHPALHVPLYAPVSEDELLTIDLIRDAHRRGAGLSLAARASRFWGVDVVTRVERG